MRRALKVGIVGVACANSLIALHETVVVDVGSDAVIRLRGYEKRGRALSAKIVSLPESGSLHQLSSVFAKYAYEPKRGIRINNPEEMVLPGSGNRVYYARPEYDVERRGGAWGIITFTVSDGSTESREAQVTLLPPSLCLAQVSFDLDTEGWSVSRNGKNSELSFDTSSFGVGLNRFVVATEELIARDAGGNEPNSSRFSFEASPQFLGHRGAAYGGSLNFTLGALAGNFGGSRRPHHNLVELECSTCASGAGIALSFPLWNSSKPDFDGATHRFSIPLNEASGWIQDPRNTLLSWPRPSKCDFIHVLNGLSALRILGDFTDWYESVALDDVMFHAPSASKVPICAQQIPCTC